MCNGLVRSCERGENTLLSVKIVKEHSCKAVALLEEVLVVLVVLPLLANTRSADEK